jgi:hypothetical protein
MLKTSQPKMIINENEPGLALRGHDDGRATFIARVRAVTDSSRDFSLRHAGV